MKNPRPYKVLDKLSTDILISEADTAICILDNRRIVPYKGTGEKPYKNVIKIIYDSSCSMSVVKLNNDVMMEGNYHDFHPGCHGGALRILGYYMGKPHWSGAHGLASLIKEYIELIAHSLATFEISSDTTAEIKIFKGKYSASGNWYNIKPE